MDFYGFSVVYQRWGWGIVQTTDIRDIRKDIRAWGHPNIAEA